MGSGEFNDRQIYIQEFLYPYVYHLSSNEKLIVHTSNRINQLDRFVSLGLHLFGVVVKH